MLLDRVQSRLDALEPLFTPVQPPLDALQPFVDPIQPRLDPIQARFDMFQALIDPFQVRFNSVHPSVETDEVHLELLHVQVETVHVATNTRNLPVDAVEPKVEALESIENHLPPILRAAHPSIVWIAESVPGGIRPEARAQDGVIAESATRWAHASDHEPTADG